MANRKYIIEADAGMIATLVENGLASILETVGNTVCLSDLYSLQEMRDETESLGRFCVEYGFHQTEYEYPLTIRTMSTDEIKNLTINGEKISDIFQKYATADQKRIVKRKAAEFDKDRIVVLCGDDVLDGNHHLMAALRANESIRYVDLIDIPE